MKGRHREKNKTKQKAKDLFWLPRKCEKLHNMLIAIQIKRNFAFLFSRTFSECLTLTERTFVRMRGNFVREREREQDLRATIYTYNVSSARAGEFVRDFELFFENQSTEIAIGGKRRSSFCSLVLLLLLWAVSEALCLCLFGEWSEFFFFFLRKRAE